MPTGRGVRIAAVRNHASTNEFVRQAKQAELVYAETPEQALALLRDGKADAMASAGPDLLLLSTNLAGARILADRYGAMLNRTGLPKGIANWQGYATEFVEEAKASGAMQQFIERG